LNKLYGALTGAALALPLTFGIALAESPMASEKKISCSEVKYGPEFLKKYPDAPAACIEAIEKNGTRYAKFKARVYLNSKDRTTVTLLSPKGEDLSTFSFKPSAEGGVHVNDKLIKFHDLKPGEKISFYVSENRLTASELPGDTQDSWSVLPPQ